MKKVKKKASPKKQSERRKSVRREVLESFHVFLVIPELGLRRIYLKDISSGGLGFFSEPDDRFEEGQDLSFFFYINPSLRLPLRAKVAHVQTQGDYTKIGCELAKPSKDAHKNAMSAYQDFIKLLERLSGFLELSA